MAHRRRTVANPAWAVQITRLNHKVSGRNRWAVLLGNGINSTDETASLLIQYLDGDRELVKLTADSTTGGGNGLSHPQVIDLDNNGTADVVYAGDQKGRLWKFDLTDTNPSQWKVAFNGNPLFVARGEPDPANPSGGGVPQPITTAPTWAYNRISDGSTTINGLNLMFATGRNITPLDPASAEVQTIYSVWDNTHVALTINTSGERRCCVDRRAALSRTAALAAGASLHPRTPNSLNQWNGWYFHGNVYRYVQLCWRVSQTWLVLQPAHCR
jgi:type IV pilus assembly protein PilY1